MCIECLKKVYKKCKKKCTKILKINPLKVITKYDKNNRLYFLSAYLFFDESAHFKGSCI